MYTAKKFHCPVSTLVWETLKPWSYDWDKRENSLVHKLTASRLPGISLLHSLISQLDNLFAEVGRESNNMASCHVPGWNTTLLFLMLSTQFLQLPQRVRFGSQPCNYSLNSSPENYFSVQWLWSNCLGARRPGEETYNFWLSASVTKMLFRCVL